MKKSISDIIQGAYLLPVLLSHWDSPTPETTKILKDVDISEMYKLRDLIKYHAYFLRTGIENYPLLRKGLDQYFNIFLCEIFNILDINRKELYMLDYGAGNGEYSKQFIFDNPKSQVLAVDKSFNTSVGRRISYLNMDFELYPDWYNAYYNTFDVVLMSELLHCKNFKGQEYLIHSAQMMLKKGGILIINENIDYEMAWRISKLKGYNRPVVDEKRIVELTKDRFQRKQYEIINQHHVYVYERI